MRKPIEEVEEILILSDIGVKAYRRNNRYIKKKFKENAIRDVTDIKTLLKKELIELLQNNTSLNLKASPSVILVVGVNGVGKTTTIGKLGYKFSSEGKSVVFAAADTFRAAAIEQLEVWAIRVGADVINNKAVQILLLLHLMLWNMLNQTIKM